MKPPIQPIVPERQFNAVKKQKSGRTPTHIEYKNIDPRIETALYYGFTPLSTPLSITKEDHEKAKMLGDASKADSLCLMPTLQEKAAMFRYFEEKHMSEYGHPIMFSAEFTPSGKLKDKSDKHRLTFEIMGSNKSIAEATLIQTGLATLKNEGHNELSVALNSVGDRESLNRFVRELTNYYRKHIASLPQACKTLLRKNPIELLTCDHEKCRTLAEEAPQSISFLGDESRRHFKEVLEFLEELEIPFGIDPKLISNRLFASETLFEIRETTENGTTRPLCSGVRYNTLGKRLGLKREVPSIGMNLLLSRSKKESAATRRVLFKRPSIFFFQLGFCAKLKSLRVIETLRKAGIPLYQSLNRDKLLSQVSSIENMKIPYSIILGQREALENSVIVRNTQNRAQETVKLHQLADHLKKLKLA